jgi:hypothetical protein
LGIRAPPTFQSTVSADLRESEWQNFTALGLPAKVNAAVVVRKIGAEAPTLLLDESDAAFGGDKEYAEALRGVPNAGHERNGKASCCVGQDAGMQGCK